MEVMCTASYPVANLAGNAIPAEPYRVKATIFRRPNGLSFSGPSNMFEKSVSLSSFRSFSTFSPMAIGSNTSEDTDDMYDDLFKKYGKVVYTRNDQKSPIAEVDDDAESLAFAVAAAKVASDAKAGDIRVLFVKPLVYWTRFFIITTAFSRPQIEAIRHKIKDLAENDYRREVTGDAKPNSWTLLDFGDVVVHIFLPEQRAYYNLEEFYANATQIELPSENRRPSNT
ncbi:protein Iojap, chloroplastic [Daucus carota subsp. sativus]|uniref:protein Iojap, chloroplastic n=1 Tax=Daucus carota subsp. sativus TaxID=79200 RepID=UPI0007B2863C|nr:PREDICTED: protein Iojap, chloroplastic [Daucus carota subsp. sativus]